MTVRELIKRLEQFDQNALVYVPSLEGPINNGTVAFVARLSHENIDSEMRISISDDIALLPGDMENYVTESEDINDRMGDT